jgi:tetratricopeptide (TPR) repeat protein
MKGWFWLIALVGWAAATPLEEGQFSAAYEQGNKAGGSNGWVLAARAANFYASYQAKGDSDALAWFGRAQSAAQKALEVNPRSASAHFELARAVGGTLQSQNLLSKASLAAVMRDHLNEALRLNPTLTEAKVALALWNLEVAEAGIGWLYGADKNRVKPLFEEALRIDPQSPVIYTWYAEVLTRLGEKDQARIQLEKAVALTPRDAVERIEQGFARERLARLR